MRLIIKNFILLALISFSFEGSSQTLNEAKELLSTGECEQAAEILRAVISAKPKDGEASYQLGLALQCIGAIDEAQKSFKSAAEKGWNEAYLELAEIALDKYEIETAESYIEKYRAGLKKGKKIIAEDNSGDFDDRLDRITAMLERVEKIVIIDSVEIDQESFLKAYNLARKTATLTLPQEILPKGTPYADPTVVFETGDSRERMWAMQNDNNAFELVTSSALFGNEWDTPVSLGDVLNEGGDANYPFLMSDGMTLYFANDGQNSIGGYDIFITRRDGEEFLQPTNLGLPYNSPFNDYMLAIDETQGIGWWATDRHQHPGKVTVYTFIPSDMRINYDINDASLKSRARIDSYRATWDDKNYEPFLMSLSSNTNAIRLSSDTQFSISIPNKGVYKTLNQFNNREAKELAQLFIDNLTNLHKDNASLKELRKRYSKGEKGVASQILELESSTEELRKELSNLKNEIIILESN
ncbi:MAG: hypothetical protein J1E99_00940 [Muribaculaceae bacterium]|nr:hypothetical protein [Muribaculaceae bacterium]